MTRFLERIHSIGVHAWVRFVQWLNWIALTLAGAVTAFNAMYPHAVNEAAAALPPIVKLIVLAAWTGVIHYALRRAKKAA